MLQYYLNGARRKETNQLKWPPSNTVFRGSGLPAKQQAFFQSLAGTDQWYRVPHPLASSFDESTAYKFMGYQPHDMPKCEWTIKLNSKKGCVHVNFMDASEVPGESEYLFSAYSAFKVCLKRTFMPPSVTLKCQLTLSKSPLPCKGILAIGSNHSLQVISYEAPSEGDGSDRDCCIRITIEAHYDNAKAPEDLPSSPWH